jgi:hypothetical protein
MTKMHSVAIPFYRVSYKKLKGGKRSVSYLSQCMLSWVDLRKALRGRVRGEYYIRGDIREEFERIAHSLETDISVTELGDAESAHLRRILGKQGTFLPPTLTGASLLDENTSPEGAIPLELHEKIAGINDAIQRIENQIQIDVPEGNIAPVTEQQYQLNEGGGNRADWQDVFAGFQLYRDIFRTGMDNPKTQDGLYAALSEVSKRGGLTEKEILDKMDVALKIARKYVRIGQ